MGVRWFPQGTAGGDSRWRDRSIHRCFSTPRARFPRTRLMPSMTGVIIMVSAIQPRWVTVRPILLQRIWITPSGHAFTTLGCSMYQRLSLADVGVCMHA
jgi:hypothetical protein